MKAEKTKIAHIPAIIWGEAADGVYIHVHGKQSCKEEAVGFAQIAESRGFQTLSFDLPEHGRRNDGARCDPMDAGRELALVADYAFSRWREVSVFGCSIGAYFSLVALADRDLHNSLFLSPILDMEHLIAQMFLWFDATEERLFAEKEIATPIDSLRWDYYSFVKQHPTDSWAPPCAILYGGRDFMQSEQIVKAFAQRNSCKLRISEQSGHYFSDAGDWEIFRTWLEENL